MKNDEALKLLKKFPPFYGRNFWDLRLFDARPKEAGNEILPRHVYAYHLTKKSS